MHCMHGCTKLPAWIHNIFVIDKFLWSVVFGQVVVHGLTSASAVLASLQPKVIPARSIYQSILAGIDNRSQTIKVKALSRVDRRTLSRHEIEFWKQCPLTIVVHPGIVEWPAGSGALLQHGVWSLCGARTRWSDARKTCCCKWHVVSV